MKMNPTPKVFHGVWEGRNNGHQRSQKALVMIPWFYVPECGCSAASLQKKVKTKLKPSGQKHLKQLFLCSFQQQSSLCEQFCLPPLSLYIHFLGAFEVSLLRFSNFSSSLIVWKPMASCLKTLFDANCSANLDADLRLMLLAVDFKTAFIGGGTPSLMTKTFYSTPFWWTLLNARNHVGGQCPNLPWKPIRHVWAGEEIQPFFATQALIRLFHWHSQFPMPILLKKHLGKNPQRDEHTRCG